MGGRGASSAGKRLTKSAGDGIMNNEPSAVRKLCQVLDVEYNKVDPLSGKLTTEQIIERIGGGDETEGSCSSLALAYIANQGGLDVLDYRGGESRYVFSTASNIKDIAELPGVKSRISKNTNDFKATNELLKTVEAGKEYYFSTGNHAAIIRKSEKGFEYLELQTQNNNGFKKLTTSVLKDRFEAQRSHSSYGIKLDKSSVLIDAKSLSQSSEFKEIMGYVNTSKKAQQKGANGYAK